MCEASLALAKAGPEERLLARLCAIGLSDETAAPPMVSIDWERFAALAWRQRVEPLAARGLRRIRDADVPPWVIEHFQNALATNALNSLRFASELFRVVEAFSAARIASLPLKGISVAAAFYPDISFRHAGDIDLLVAPADLDRSDGILRGLGYTRISNKTHEVVPERFVENTLLVHHLSYVGGGGAQMELHFSLHPNPRLLPVSVDTLVAAGESVRIGRLSLPTLPDALQFVFLATHGARHRWRRLQWVCDIGAMTNKASPDELAAWLEAARAYDLFNPAVQGLVMASRLLGVALPAAAAVAYRRSMRIRYMVRQAELAIFRTLAEEPDNAPAGLDLGVRLYRMCMTARPDYHWSEAWRGVQSVWTRVARTDSA